MPWNPALSKLRDVLADLYTDESDSRVVIVDTGLDIQHIDQSSKAITNWQAILAEAEKTDKIDALLNVVLKRYGSKQELRDAATEYRLIRAAKKWEELGYDESALYQDKDLEQALKWAAAYFHEFNENELVKRFIGASLLGEWNTLDPIQSDKESTLRRERKQVKEKLNRVEQEKESRQQMPSPQIIQPRPLFPTQPLAWKRYSTIWSGWIVALLAIVALGVSNLNLINNPLPPVEPMTISTPIQGKSTKKEVSITSMSSELVSPTKSESTSASTPTSALTFKCTDVNEDECAALVALYNSTDGPHWITKTNWLETNTPCNSPWYGLTCENGRVTKLLLNKNGLRGVISPKLGSFSNLTVLEMAGNPLLGGTIPLELGKLTNLKLLVLASNQLAGSIPSPLGNLVQLQTLDLSENQFTGVIPGELGQLDHLEYLYLHRNQLGGSIPNTLGELNNLRWLIFANNQLDNVIPPEIGNLFQLERLNLRHNKLTGSIPPELGNLTSLQFLGLHENQLSGTIPSQLANLSNLIELGLGENRLVGAIPSQLGLLKNLEYLELYQNGLTGPIPPQLGNLSKLKALRLYNNFGLSGSIPRELGNLKALEKLHLSGNQLSGLIPSNLCQPPNLQQLDLNYNALTAADDSELRNCLAAKAPDWTTTQRILSPATSPELFVDIPAGQVWFNPVAEAVYVYVPGGDFVMGSTQVQLDAIFGLCQPLYTKCNQYLQTITSTQPVNVDGFWIMQTEVTNDQYRPFVEAGGYAQQDLWSVAGWQWRTANNITTPEPKYWNSEPWNLPPYPVVGISWYEAEAYAHWLARETGLNAQLPTEAQWEKAARGTDKRIYPWGNDWDGSRTNYCDTTCQCGDSGDVCLIKDENFNDGYPGTAPVGSYPLGSSPYGALDMAGNVGEWTMTLWETDQNVQGNVERQDLTLRVLRGGGFNNMAGLVATTLRGSRCQGQNCPELNGSSDFRHGDIGFRVVIAQPGNQ